MGDTFRGSKSGKEVTLNTTSDVLILKSLTVVELRKEIACFEKVRIEEFWEVLQAKASSGDWVEGLRNYSAVKTGSNKGTSVPCYFQGAALKKMVGEDLTMEVATEKLRRLSLTEQRRRLKMVMPEKAADLSSVLRTEKEKKLFPVTYTKLSTSKKHLKNLLIFYMKR